MSHTTTTATAAATCRCGHEYSDHTHGGPGGSCMICAKVEGGLRCHHWHGPAVRRLPNGCPSWCATDHDAERAEGETTPLHGCIVEYGDRYRVEVTEYDGAASVWVGTSSTDDELPPVEARALASALIRAADLAEGVDR